MAKEYNYQITKNLNEKKLREICSFFNSRNLKELELKEGEMEILLKSTPSPQELVPMSMGNMSLNMNPNMNSTAVAAPTSSPSNSTEEYQGNSHDGTPITAPISGNFYAAPSPEDPPFVKVGDKVKKGDRICIIEAMKVLNEIAATQGGTVTAILVENGKPVKQGDALITVK